MSALATAAGWLVQFQQWPWYVSLPAIVVMAVVVFVAVAAAANKFLPGNSQSPAVKPPPSPSDGGSMLGYARGHGKVTIEDPDAEGYDNVGVADENGEVRLIGGKYRRC